MGVSEPIIKFERSVLYSLNLVYHGLNWCELGDQVDEKGVACKFRYEKLGCWHVSLDINGRHGSRKVDLCKPIPKALHEVFDLVTNYGDTEHIPDQFMSFLNCHDLCKVGGLMLHVLPRPGFWVGHCQYYYPPSFFMKLAEVCGYEVVAFDNGFFDGRSTAVAFVKGSGGFLSREEFDKLGVVDSGDGSRTGNYTKLLPTAKRVLKRFLKNA